eukprot:CAMPEP_0172887048 /NCGR_PEP_ID=MMETSP1075-20121228/132829_1 /TAXON_ID=2916 /ORGANISM="Ceratium fusus, Strain PA161109" /LENGTH=141 /DNA_ID=CAMNT_0013740649 /DNA_START=67 /DNA_END=493 /DNA_ORIENTATION=-
MHGACELEDPVGTEHTAEDRLHDHDKALAISTEAKIDTKKAKERGSSDCGLANKCLEYLGASSTSVCASSAETVRTTQRPVLDTRSATSSPTGESLCNCRVGSPSSCSNISSERSLCFHSVANTLEAIASNLKSHDPGDRA